MPQPMESRKESKDGNTHTRTIEVINKMGIHARPAARIVRLANKYQSEVYVERGSDLVNGKSIILSVVPTDIDLSKRCEVPVNKFIVPEWDNKLLVRMFVIPTCTMVTKMALGGLSVY